MKETWNALRGVVALLAVGAVCLQAWHLMQIDRFALSQFISFFTIQSNLIAATVLAIEAAGGFNVPSARRDALRGAVVLYLTVTAVVYAVLLSRLPIVKEIVHPWADPVLHYVVPLFALVDWVVMPPPSKPSFRRALLWIIYPLGYLTFSLTRGALTGWYPYPFLNPNSPGGWTAVAIVSSILILFGIALIWVIVWIAKWRCAKIDA